MAKLMTAEQVADAYGLPSPRTVRTMRIKGLPAVRLGKAYLYDANDVERHIEESKVTRCQDQTRARPSNGSQSGDAFTSSGTKRAASESVRLARQTVERLKTLSPRSSATAGATSG